MFCAGSGKALRLAKWRSIWRRHHFRQALAVFEPRLSRAAAAAVVFVHGRQLLAVTRAGQLAQNIHTLTCNSCPSSAEKWQLYDAC